MRIAARGTHVRARARAAGRLAPGALAVVAALAAGPVVAPREASATVRLHPEGSRLDLVLIGFAVFQTNLSEEIEAFFDASDQLPAELTNRQLLNLRVEGRLTGTVGLDARIAHDRESLRDWRYLVRVKGERNEVALGELDGAFRDSQFLRYDTSYYGLAGRVGLGPITTEAFATARDGSWRVDRLRGSNLSGPYFLSASPVLEGSERVAIEIRDRRDQERLVSSDARVRGRDYQIDYGSGSIVFNEPIESETFDGNPVLVVVDYRFRPAGASGDGGSDLLAGARVSYAPAAGMRLGATLLRADGDAGPLGQGLVGLDQSIRLGSWLQLDGEVAGPRASPFDRTHGAWRLGGTLKPVDALEVRGRYRRVGGEFETAANPRLDTELDREEWELDTAFVPSLEHRFSAGYGVKLDNVARDDASDQTRVRTMFAGWEAQVHGWPVLRLRMERRLTDGPASFGGGVSRIDSLSVDLEEDHLGRLPLLGDTGLKAQYRLETIDDAAGGTGRRSHALRARLDAEPLAGLEGFLEWRGSFATGLGGAAIDSRTQELLGGGRYRLGPALSASASLRLRSTVDALADPSSTDQATAVFDVRFEPSERIKALLKYEWTLSESGHGGALRKRNLYAQAAVVPVEGLTASLGWKLDDRGNDGAGALGGLDGEYHASLLYRRGDRLTLFARAERGLSEERLPPFEPTLSERMTWLVGASIAVTRDWGVLAELKQEELAGALAADRRALVLEVSRAVSRLLRVGVGTELLVDEQGAADRLDRRRVYLKLIGTL